MVTRGDTFSLAGHEREAYPPGEWQEATDTKIPHASGFVAVTHMDAVLETISKVGPWTGLPLGGHKKMLTREEPGLSDVRPQWQQTPWSEASAKPQCSHKNAQPRGSPGSRPAALRLKPRSAISASRASTGSFQDPVPRRKKG